MGSGVQTLRSGRIDVTLVQAAFGAYPPPPLPDALAELLFQGDQGPCYALLDAARLPEVPDILTGSGLEHACLFQGEAEADLAEVAPWLVRLTPDSRLTRRLLSGADSRWGLWGKDGAVFLRSTDDLASLRRHFRRMTRLQDPDSGRWFLFRFYAAPTMRDLVAGMEPARLRRFCGPVRRFVVPDGADAVRVIDRPEIDGDHAAV